MHILVNRSAALIVLIVLSLLGCAHTKGTEDAEDGSRTEFFIGNQEVSISNGRVVAGSTVFLRRVLQPSRKTIEDEFYDVGNEDSTWNRYVVVMTVSGSGFTLRETSGAFNGTGDFEGEPWEWSGWRSISHTAQGNTIESTDRLRGDSLTTEKVVKAPDGRFVVKVAETLIRVEEGEFERRKEALVLPGKSVR